MEATSFATEYRTAVLRWRTTPATFVTECFGVTPDPWQAVALQSLADHGRVSIRACHGPGKSAVDAWSVFWFLSCHFPARVPCTAPTAHQLEDILWAELAKWMQAMQPWQREMFRLTASRLEWVGAPSESFAVARTARKEKPEALQGFHCENLLFVLDEASGIEDVIFEVAEGALSSENAKVLMTANPTRTSGYFFDSHHRMRHRWHTMRVSYEDSPRVSEQYVEDMAAKYGVESNVYRVRVGGDFPLEDDDSVISLDLCESAMARDIREDMGAATVWGLDVARFGDDATALVKRRGPVVLGATQWRGKDTMQTAGIVKDAYDGEKPTRQPQAIYVDSIGLGSGVVDRLRELGLPVRGVNVAESPAVKERFMRLRDELWFSAREWLETRSVKLPDVEELVGQLTGPKYAMTSAGKIKVESKDDMKARGIVSPDLADAFCLTFHRSAPKGTGKHRKLNYAWQKAIV